MAKKGACSNCQTCSWVEEELGCQVMEVCSKCGKCKESNTYVSDDCFTGTPSGSKLAYGGGPSSQGKFHAPRNLQRVKEMRLINAIKQAAVKLNLSKQNTDRCVSRGKMLLKTDYNIGKKTKKFAAGLVFLDMKARSPTLSFKDYSDQAGMKKTDLCRIVKELRILCGEVFKEPPSDMCFQDVMDKLTLTKQLSDEMKINVKKLAMELKEICADSPLNGQLIKCNKTADCAYFTLALEHLDPEQEIKSITKRICKDTGLHFPTLRNRIWKIKNVLLALAKTLPSLEHVRDQLTVQSIRGYITTVVRNKTFLTKGTERFFGSYSLDDEEGEKEYCVASASHDRSQREEEEEEGTLSDLDSEIEQYIASEKEVEEKKAIQRLISS